MRINSNVSALNTHRLLNKNSNKLQDSLERLSSGKSINKASDDAAGLAISEKMNAQIRGLRQASRNSLDGISLIQTGEGGLNEMNQIIQRIRELAVQSSNDTYNKDDRSVMQDEVLQLIEELESIANKTEFNGIYLLNGNENIYGEKGEGGGLKDIVESITDSGGITDKYIYKDSEETEIKLASGIIDFGNLESNEDIRKLANQGFHYSCCTCDKKYSIKFVDKDASKESLNDYHPIMEVDIREIDDGKALVKKINETAYGKEYKYIPTEENLRIPNKDEGKKNSIPDGATSFVDHFSQIWFEGTKLYIYDNRSKYAETNWPENDRGVFEPYVYDPLDEKDKKGLLVDIQTGSNEGERLTIKIPNVNTESLGIKEDLSVETREKANLAIIKSDNALRKIVSARSKLGAYQNRLEHTISNLDNTAENLQSAESRITDMDMALEMSNFTKLNILQQASISMLSEANNLPQAMLQLLK